MEVPKTLSQNLTDTCPVEKEGGRRMEPARKKSQDFKFKVLDRGQRDLRTERMKSVLFSMPKLLSEKLTHLAKVH